MMLNQPWFIVLYLCGHLLGKYVNYIYVSTSVSNKCEFSKICKITFARRDVGSIVNARSTDPSRKYSELKNKKIYKE